MRKRLPRYVTFCTLYHDSIRSRAYRNSETPLGERGAGRQHHLEEEVKTYQSYFWEAGFGE